MRTGFHNENTNEIKDTFDDIDKTSDGSISLDEWIKFGKSNKFNFDTRQAIVDRLTNALKSNFFDTDSKYQIVLHINHSSFRFLTASTKAVSE